MPKNETPQEEMKRVISELKSLTEKVKKKPEICDELAEAMYSLAEVTHDYDNHTKRLVMEFSSVVNNLCCPYKELAEQLCREHRTLQQSFFRMLIECLHIWAQNYDNNFFDARNEQTCKLSRKIVDAFREELYVPLI